MDYSRFGVDYASAASCTRYIGQKLADYDLLVDADVGATLEATARKDAGGRTVYRPYTVIASLLDTAINTTHLNKGRGGVELRDADKVISAWRTKQAEIDGLLGLAVSGPLLDDPRLVSDICF